MNVPRAESRRGISVAGLARACLPPLAVGLVVPAALAVGAALMDRAAILDTGAFFVVAGGLALAVVLAGPLGHRGDHTTWTSADHPRDRPMLGWSLRALLVAAPSAVFIAVQIVTSL